MEKIKILGQIYEIEEKDFSEIENEIIFGETDFMNNKNNN